LLDRPFLDTQNQYIMNKTTATLIVVGLVALTIGGLVMHFRQASTCQQDTCLDASDHGKYVICFGDCDPGTTQTARVFLSNPQQFRNALDTTLKPHIRMNSLTEQDGGGSAYPIGPPPISTPDLPVAHVHVVQRKTNQQPCTMHVTQKIAFDNLDDVRVVLNYLQQPP